jgi:hypothetical protein
MTTEGNGSLTLSITQGPRAMDWPFRIRPPPDVLPNKDQIRNQDRSRCDRRYATPCCVPRPGRTLPLHRLYTALADPSDEGLEVVNEDDLHCVARMLGVLLDDQPPMVGKLPDRFSFGCDKRRFRFRQTHMPSPRNSPVPPSQRPQSGRRPLDPTSALPRPWRFAGDPASGRVDPRPAQVGVTLMLAMSQHLGLELFVGRGWDVALARGEVFLGDALDDFQLGKAAHPAGAAATRCRL